MTYKDILLTADFDRTLTAPDSTVPERNCRAIRDFMAKGGAFTVNTGRSLPMYGAHRFDLPVNAPLLLYNGSAAVDRDTGTLLWCRRFALERGPVIREMLARYPDLVLELQGLKAHYLFRKDEMWEKYCETNGCAWGYACPEDDGEPFLKFTFYQAFQAPTVADLFRASPEQLARMDQVEAELHAIFGEEASVYRAAPRIIDVHAGGVSKARAARELQERLGRRLLICVGDGKNDIPMMECADYAFCPADSVLADRFPTVCPCAEGAVAHVIWEKIPGILAEKA